MIVRALTIDHDWTFGKGREDYLSNQAAVIQTINCRLQMVLGDCFFAVNQGIDLWNLVGGKNDINLGLAIVSTILNTQFQGNQLVTGILQLSFNLSPQRVFSVAYQVQTIYSTTAISGQFSLDIGTQG